MSEGEAEEEDIAMEEPCFNLLGSGASVFAVETTVNDPCTTDETNSRDGGVAVDEDLELSSSPRYPDFMPASRVHIKETEIDDKLASAGLILSDSEDEEDEPKLLRRQNDENGDNSWEDKWVCQICTNMNDQTEMECSSCSFKRYREPPLTVEPTEGPSLRWACHICTNLNPPDATDCLMCLSTRKKDEGSNERWKCSLCATFNAPGTTRCELCDRSRDEPKKVAAKGPQCPVCTNINAPGRKRCELCDSSLPTDEEIPEDHFVDLSSSPLERKPSYTIEDDLENPYADLSQFEAYDAPNEVADADPDYLEDISDNEPAMSLTTPRPLTVRSELKEFEHFVCMEDLRNDYGCRINYKKMFAGQRSRKSYADRLATRQAESRKRKRNVARKEAGEAPASSKRGKAGNGSKKRKTSASPRRASAGGTRGKRAKKTGASARRASSATTSSPGINHYDDSGADFGEDLNTMAWEGVGSAGYH
ncbi:Zinc-finger in Ran binding protein [Phytophthora infestans]|uniref:Zinc-finger in Ran binding protein n=1 Tax=Phytophthora infestans TaxID=4787 RepID=A0A8S9UVK4_PHYIN|nr:Zinc-finger in Ran binding protein [Phytophthora infestans]KAF4144098.1 Zinc-finger in Ran binding protein [Phytophthora infestans]